MNIKVPSNDADNNAEMSCRDLHPLDIPSRQRGRWPRRSLGRSMDGGSDDTAHAPKTKELRDEQTSPAVTGLVYFLNLSQAARASTQDMDWLGHQDPSGRVCPSDCSS
jgi:hypothetical protein